MTNWKLLIIREIRNPQNSRNKAILHQFILDKCNRYLVIGRFLTLLNLYSVLDYHKDTASKQ